MKTITPTRRVTTFWFWLSVTRYSSTMGVIDTRGWWS
jgi:hypothetical protein